MSRKHVKQYLMLLLAVGVIAVALSGGGTFASFNAQVANRNNTFATGTLYLHESATNTCTSESASSNSNLNTSLTHLGDACDILFSGVNASGYDLVGLDMKNAGSLDGDGLHLALGNTANGFTQTGCVSSLAYSNIDTLGTPLVSGNAVTTIALSSPLTISIYNGAHVRLNDGTNTQIFTTSAIAHVGDTSISVVSQNANHSYTTSTPTTNVQYSPQFNGGGGNLCNDLKLEIVEVPTSGDLGNVTVDPTTGDTSAPAGSVCAYGGLTNGTNGCDFTNATALSGIPNYSTFDDLSLKDLTGSTDPNTGTGLDAGTDRYIVLALVVDPAATNSDQSLQASFDLVWNMNQSTT